MGYFNDFLLIKIEENGNDEWDQTYCGGSAKSVQQTTDEGYIITGYTRTYDTDIWLVRLGSEVNAEDNTISNSDNLISNLTNYPNPFNPTTKIHFTTKEISNVRIDVYNIKGQLVKSLVNEQQDAGDHSVIWNGDDEVGNSVGSGVYLYKLRVNGKFKTTRKCLLLK